MRLRITRQDIIPSDVFDILYAIAEGDVDENLSAKQRWELLVKLSRLEDEAGAIGYSPLYERVVKVMEEFVKLMEAEHAAGSDAHYGDGKFF
jgi:hypothetical protein